MPVAKSYKGFEQGEPYEKNGKEYIKINKNGSIREVRWYSWEEYLKKYPDEKPPYELGVCGGRKLGTLRNAIGFRNGPITLVRGDTESVRAWLSEQGATYRTFWGWAFESDKEVPILPSGFRTYTLKWEDISLDDDHLKPQDQIEEHINSLIYGDSTSKWQGQVGERLSLQLTVKQIVELTKGAYGTSYFHVFSDSAGNEYTWNTTSKRLEINNTYSLKGTVKAHQKYKGKEQTTLTRCALDKI